MCELFICLWMQRENWDHQREAGLSTYVWVTVVPRGFESLLCRDWEGNTCTLFIIICTVTRLCLYLTMRNFSKLLSLFAKFENLCTDYFCNNWYWDGHLWMYRREGYQLKQKMWYQIMLAFIKENYWFSIILFTLLLKCKL